MANLLIKNEAEAAERNLLIPIAPGPGGRAPQGGFNRPIGPPPRRPEKYGPAALNPDEDIHPAVAAGVQRMMDYQAIQDEAARLHEQRMNAINPGFHPYPPAGYVYDPFTEDPNYDEDQAYFRQKRNLDTGKRLRTAGLQGSPARQARIEAARKKTAKKLEWGITYK